VGVIVLTGDRRGAWGKQYGPTPRSLLHQQSVTK
jgi:hypothetical protein